MERIWDMSKSIVRLEIELEIDEEAAAEHGLTSEQIVAGIVCRQSDVIDGVEITTELPGCNCVSDFFLRGQTILAKKLISGGAREENRSLLRYYEVSCNLDPESAGGFFDQTVCIKGARKPSCEEAAVFLRSLIDSERLEVSSIREISRAEAMAGFDLDRENEWPVFGMIMLVEK